MATILAVATTVASAPSWGLAEDATDTSALSDEVRMELAEHAAELGIEPIEAYERYEASNAAADLIEELRRNHPESFAGAWFDLEDSRRTAVIGFQGAPPSDAITVVNDHAESPNSPLFNRVRIASVPRSYSDLLALKAAVLDYAVQDSRFRGLIAWIGIDPSVNAVRISVTDTQSPAVDDLLEAFDETEVVVQEGPRLTLAACREVSCADPAAKPRWRANLLINYPVLQNQRDVFGPVAIIGEATCTSAFNVYYGRYYDGWDYGLTAGHCFGVYDSVDFSSDLPVTHPAVQDPSEAGYDPTIAATASVVGTPFFANCCSTTAPGRMGDFAMYSIDRPWATSNYKYVNETSNKSNVSQAKASFVNDTVCIRGAVSQMTDCGRIMAVDLSLETGADNPGELIGDAAGQSWWIDSLSIANICAQRGDSGGAVYYGGSAVGVISSSILLPVGDPGGDPDRPQCPSDEQHHITAYTDVIDILNDRGAYLRTSNAGT